MRGDAIGYNHHLCFVDDRYRKQSEGDSNLTATGVSSRDNRVASAYIRENA